MLSKSDIEKMETNELLEIGSTDVFATKNFLTLPVNNLKVSELIGQHWLANPQSSFYSMDNQKCFYGVNQLGDKIGKEFPAWQFVLPVPDLIEPIVKMFNGVPDSEIHAFWVSEADELNSLSPAEVLAGLPFVTRETIFSSQANIFNAPIPQRVSRVTQFAELKLKNVAELIG